MAEVGGTDTRPERQVNMTPEQQQHWMQQWHRAAVELERVRRAELARMTDAEALQATDRILALVGSAYAHPQRWTTSGLVEQQRWFRKGWPPA